MKKILMYILLGALLLISVFVIYFFIGKAPKAKKIIWGVNFSQKHAQNLGLDWRKNYLALLNDLGVKELKVATYWDLLEPQKDEYYFDDLDWQIREAEKHKAKILLVIGMKTPRWPECHIPNWAVGLKKGERQKEILALLQKIVERYKNSNTIEYWQVENEPFFPFGKCPRADENFFKKEVNLVRSIDPGHPIIISDSGEGSFWIRAAKWGDIVGTTMYKKVWFKELNIYVRYPFPPVFYWRKAEIIRRFFNKKVICVEFQAEPWGPVLLYDLSPKEQKKTMDLRQFQYNIKFAKETGLSKFYLWGAEWWYWLKEKQNDPRIWNEAKLLF